LKSPSKEEAGNVFQEFERGQHDLWGVSPERILHLADSASITMNKSCFEKCSECAVVVKQGEYVIFVNFKGPEDVLRERLKTMAIKIVNMMYDRIPGLAPQCIRNKGGGVDD
jgi:ferredoxin